MTVLLRLTGVALTAAMAAIHLYLWGDGYRYVATIGVLFLLNGIVGCVLAAALLVTPARFLEPVAAVTALFTAGTLGALVLSLTTGLLGFEEVVEGELVVPTLAVETAGVLVLAVLSLRGWAARRGDS
ncbi:MULTISPECIES: hypothetical protein [unclassified Streptomyces]|uniref:hypothetical protein n=1 Tax=unclassified Streptomyces TaxID=2593676 RepID=UPI002E32FABF|nr:hypothetical protein [Streptomyces sp. NBC_01268]